jgi:Na+-driven multidrug efflux pump
MGRSTIAAMFAFFGTCVFRVIWIFTVFEYFKTLEVIYISYPISWFITGGVSFVFAIKLLRKKLSQNHADGLAPQITAAV